MEALIGSYGPIGKPASFAVKIMDDHGTTHQRVVPLKLQSKYQAELAAIKYICHAVANKDKSLVIKTSISHIPQIFAKTNKGKWVRRKKPNKLVDEVRELSTQFASFECIIGSELELSEIKKLAKLTR